MSNTKTVQSLAWAAVILGAAFTCQALGMSEPASAGIVLGLSGAALGSIQSDTPCSRGCLQ